MTSWRKSVNVTGRLSVRFPIEGMTYYLLIFSFLHFSTKAKVFYTDSVLTLNYLVLHFLYTEYRVKLNKRKKKK